MPNHQNYSRHHDHRRSARDERSQASTRDRHAARSRSRSEIRCNGSSENRNSGNQSRRDNNESNGWKLNRSPNSQNQGHKRSGRTSGWSNHHDKESGSYPRSKTFQYDSSRSGKTKGSRTSTRDRQAAHSRSRSNIRRSSNDRKNASMRSKRGGTSQYDSRSGRDDRSFRRYHHSGDTHHRSHSEYNQDQGSKRSHHVKSSRYDNSGSGRDDRSLRRYYRSGDTYHDDRSRIRSEIHRFENQERRTSDSRDRRPKRDDSKTPDRSSNQKDFRQMSGHRSDSEYGHEQNSRRSQRAEKSNRSPSGRRSVEMQRQDQYDNFVGESRSPDNNHTYLRRRNESEGSGGNRPTRGDAPAERMSRKDIFQEEIVSRFVLADGADIDWWAANPKCVEDDEEVVDVRKFNKANFEMVEQDVWDDILDYYDVKIFRLDQSSQLEISGKLKNVEDAWKDVDKTMLDIFYKKTTKEDGLFDFEFHVPAKFRGKLENREWTILLMNGDLFDVRQCVREDYSDENECFQLNGPVLHLEKLRNELLERLEGLEDEIPLRIQLGNNVIHDLLLDFAEKFYELEKRTNTRVRFHQLRQEWETVYVYIFGKRNDIKACRDELTALDAELRGE